MNEQNFNKPPTWKCYICKHDLPWKDPGLQLNQFTRHNMSNDSRAYFHQYQLSTYVKNYESEQNDCNYAIPSVSPFLTPQKRNSLRVNILLLERIDNRPINILFPNNQVKMVDKRPVD